MCFTIIILTKLPNSHFPSTSTLQWEIAIILPCKESHSCHSWSWTLSFLGFFLITVNDPACPSLDFLRKQCPAPFPFLGTSKSITSSATLGQKKRVFSQKSNYSISKIKKKICLCQTCHKLLWQWRKCCCSFSCIKDLKHQNSALRVPRELKCDCKGWKGGHTKPQQGYFFF